MTKETVIPLNKYDRDVQQALGYMQATGASFEEAMTTQGYHTGWEAKQLTQQALENRIDPFAPKAVTNG